MAYERNWSFSTNNLYVPTSNADQTLYEAWALKAMLLGQYGGLTGSGLWTTYGSCDGAGNFGNGDLVDRWGSTYDPTKIVLGNAGSAHSWYVLKSPLMNGVNWYLLIAADSTTATTIRLYMAKTAFSAGTNTANPTSVDSWGFGSNSAFNSGNSANIPNRLNMTLSDAGDFVFYEVQSGLIQPNSAHLCVGVIAPVGCNGSDNFPIWAFKRHDATSFGGFSSIVMFSTNVGNSTLISIGGAAIASFLGGSAVSVNFSVPDALTGRYPGMPCRIIVTSPSAFHLRGRLPDIRGIPGSTAGPPSGLTIRDGSNNVTFVLVGGLWIPCGPSVPIFT